jgi:hypothetical protein
MEETSLSEVGVCRVSAAFLIDHCLRPFDPVCVFHKGRGFVCSVLPSAQFSEDSQIGKFSRLVELPDPSKSKALLLRGEAEPEQVCFFAFA